ncbi:2-thiouracil desulfurase family protein [Halobacillus litoralis]|uniref:2-thiouracil desulfurase family protein n=1 Tax=Halobacillus litoralis TaxID=45668 RepID=UPI0013718802|nr:DUF523 domain-containing protein [Halobacillus litoralis]
MILISSCLAGIKVRYDGTDCLQEEVQKLILEKRAVSACPELLGGFMVPRPPAEIVGGDGEDVLRGRARVMEKTGTDVTETYIRGAYLTLEKVRDLNIDTVVLKEGSPSCGSTVVHDGTFSGRKVSGKGVTTALLERNGIQVMSEIDFIHTLV